MSASFWDFNIGEVITLVGVGVVYLQYRIDQRNANSLIEDSKTEMIERQTKQHMENQQRLELLTNFHENQLNINARRDEQVQELKLQTATLGQIAKALDRRVEMLENRRVS